MNVSKVVLSMSFLFIGLSYGVSQAAPLCSTVLAGAKSPRPRIFSLTGLKIFNSQTSLRKMIYDFKPGAKKEVFLLIHGLGDDMTKMEALAVQAERDGFGILRVDLHGHGMTLKKYLKDHANRLPEELNFEDNINDIKEMVNTLNISEVVIVGHSYGGGIAYGLAAGLGKGANSIKVNSVHMLAPYVQRVDKFLADYIQSPEFLMDKTVETMEKTGVPSIYVKLLMDPFFSMVRAMTSSSKRVNDYITRTMKVDQAKDYVMDPFVENFMQKAYRKYFILASKKTEAEMTPAEIAVIEMKVNASIKVTKGIRTFDLLDTSAPLPIINAPLQVIGGKKDALVIPAQLQNFDRRLNNEGIAHKMDFIEGMDSTHLFPQLMAIEVYQKIRKFMVQNESGIKN